MLYRIHTDGNVRDSEVCDIRDEALATIVQTLDGMGHKAVVNGEILHVDRESKPTASFPFPVEGDILTCTFFHEGNMLSEAEIHAIFAHLGSLGPLLQHDPLYNIWYYRTGLV